MLLILFILLAGSTYEVPDEKQLLRKGQELEEKGLYEQALQAWSRALSELETPSLAIGREHIRLATDHRLSSYYQIASEMYIWGLSAEKIEDNTEAMQAELSMLEPLVDKKTTKFWQELFKERDPKLYKELQLFWQNQDPTPATVYNERLIEHWERIAYARKHFTRNDNTAYATDDRGLYWVRYGHPDRKYDGQLIASRGKVKMLCDGTLVPCNGDMMANAVMELDQHPYYEIWIYRRPNTEMEYNLVLMFGDNRKNGFGRAEALEDFIPSSAFSFPADRFAAFSLLTGNKYTAGNNVVSPGMVMQWLYYEQLAAKDFYFADRFEQMVLEWDRPHSPMNPNPFIGKHAGPLHEQQTEMATIQNMHKAPVEVSTYEKLFPAIPFEIFQYRLLDDNGRPVTATFLESLPHQVLLEDLLANQDSMFTENVQTTEHASKYYELIHGLQLKGSEGDILSQSRLPVELVFNTEGAVPVSSVFMVPVLSGEGTTLLYAELHNHHPDTRPIIDSPFPRTLRGLGRIEVDQPEPLRTDPGHVEMSDLMLGYQMQQDSDKQALFPFVVANDRKVPQGENLAVHVGAYHLQPDTDGSSHFQLSYEILPVNWLGRTREKKQEVSLTLNMEVRATRYSENLEIQTRILNSGKYLLRMRLHDAARGQSVSREAEFEIVN